MILRGAISTILVRTSGSIRDTIIRIFKNPTSNSIADTISWVDSFCITHPDSLLNIILKEIVVNRDEVDIGSRGASVLTPYS